MKTRLFVFPDNPRSFSTPDEQTVLSVLDAYIKEQLLKQELAIVRSSLKIYSTGAYLQF